MLLLSVLICPPVVVVTVLVAVTLLASTGVKVKVSWIGRPRAPGSLVVLPGPAGANHPPAVPTTLPVTLAAVLVPLLL